VTSEYVKITGDKDILKTQISYLEATVLGDDELERYSIPAVSGKSATLFEHCVSAINRSLTAGIHGLPLMGSGDWNDGMNGVGIKGSGESVWLGWFLITVLKNFAPLCIEMEEPEREEEYREEMERITKAVEETAWDGKWYRRAYFDDGTPLGSIQNAECKIDSIAQSWAVLSGAGEKERARQAMSSLEDYLVVRTDGLIKLLTPPFDQGEMEPGYIQGYVPGVRENGGQYTHAAAWAIMAFAKLGDGDKACELFELINPINNTNDPREYLRYKGEPYIMSSDVYSVYPHSGRSGWTWYTGSAGWMYTAALEHILGFQKYGDTLVMDPCTPKNWPGYTIRYKYMDTTYNINVRNPKGLSKAREGTVIELVNDGKVHDVEVVMG
jgi:cellobiose phosphorylase